MKISTLVSPYLTPNSVNTGLGRQTDKSTTLDPCAQEKQRGHLEASRNKAAGMGEADLGWGQRSAQREPELSALLRAKELGCVYVCV